MDKGISVIWSQNPGNGVCQIRNTGEITHMNVADGNGNVDQNSFFFHNSGSFRLDIKFRYENDQTGPNATVVHITGIQNEFSFFLRDIHREAPVYIEQYAVAVTQAEDPRDIGEISRSIRHSGRMSGLESLQAKSPASFEEAAKTTRSLRCLTIHGISRDIRLFEAGFSATNTPTDNACWIEPRYGSTAITKVIHPRTGQAVDYRYEYLLGRGMGCTNDIRRSNEEGCLPVIHACYIEEDMEYHVQLFAALEKTALKRENIRGTHYLVASKYLGYGANTEQQQKIADELTSQEIHREEEVIAFMKIEVRNTAKAPKYCFIKAPTPNTSFYPDIELAKIRLDSQTGFAYYGEEEIFMVARVDGEPLPFFEISKLIQPGSKTVFEFMIPHTRLNKSRAETLGKAVYNEKLEECKKFWQAKLSKAAVIRLPEKRIEDMLRTALVHFELLTFGQEPDGPLAAAAGVTYNPIGSESSPIIQFYDSMGLFDTAERCIQFFLDKQQESGKIHCYESYTLETGFVLWTVGEHYRYTRNDQWLAKIQDKLLLACNYIIQWIEQNRLEELRGKGFGMIDGKVADPVDPYHGYMLNAGAYIGLRRCSEILSSINPKQAAAIKQAADKLYRDIREAVRESLAKGPVIPLGNGRWVPSISPWPENIGPICLFADGQPVHPIGITVKDSLLGAMYLLLLEVVDHKELYGDFIMNSHHELYTMHNTCFSQPYYSPHPYSNLRRGETGAFLEEYYYNVSAHADRETYAFWEGYNHTSPYKTHEQAWFAMRTRWMLYLEEGDILHLLPGIPKTWINSTTPLELEELKCYFGALDLRVTTDPNGEEIKVYFKINLHVNSSLKGITVRIPHPDGRKATWVSHGRYDPGTETVSVDHDFQEISLRLKF